MAMLTHVYVDVCMHCKYIESLGKPVIGDSSSNPVFIKTCVGDGAGPLKARITCWERTHFFLHIGQTEEVPLGSLVVLPNHCWMHSLQNKWPQCLRATTLLGPEASQASEQMQH